MYFTGLVERVTDMAVVRLPGVLNNLCFICGHYKPLSRSQTYQLFKGSRHNAVNQVFLWQ